MNESWINWYKQIRQNLRSDTRDYFDPHMGGCDQNWEPITEKKVDTNWDLELKLLLKQGEKNVD